MTTIIDSSNIITKEDLVRTFTNDDFVRVSDYVFEDIKELINLFCRLEDVDIQQDKDEIERLCDLFFE